MKPNGKNSPNEIVAAEWFKKASNDLRAARVLIKSGRGFPTDAACFHVQQCVEKCIKAYLVFAKVEFPRSHDIVEITCLLPAAARPPLSQEEQRRLTTYAVLVRYPGASEPLRIAEVLRSFKLAEITRKHFRRLMPFLGSRRPR
jgi:HEPN domain-containing protein